MYQALVTFLLAALASVACVGLLLPLLIRWVPDVPGARSSHRVPIPRGAGLAVVFVVAVITLVSGWDLLALLAFVVTLALLGFLDDLVSLPARMRLIVQVVGASLVTLWIVDQASSNASPLVILVATCFVVGYVNAYNFMDGINGISGVTALVAATWYSIQLAELGQRDWALFAVVLAGACLGFLPWNVPTARGFLGDAGSYGIGSALAALAVASAAWGAGLTVVLAPILLYVADTSSTLLLRRRAGHGWAEPHRDHVYQRLVDGGLTHARVALIVGIALVLCCVVGLVPLAWLALALQAAIVATYLQLPRILSVRKEVPA